MNYRKVIVISSSYDFVKIFLLDFLKELSKIFRVNVLTNNKNKIDIPPYINMFHIPVKRKISPFSDLLSILYAFYRFIKIRPEILISVTPKSIIFGSIIKLFFPRVKRFHIYTGITWTNMYGISRFLFILLDKLNIFLSDKILFDSKEQISFLNKNRIFSKKFHLINCGSIKGVDTKVFYKYSIIKKKKIRIKNNIPLEKKVILYLGRIDIEKGILNLLESFKIISKTHKDAILLIVGKDEMNITYHIDKFDKYLLNKIIIRPHTHNAQDIYNIANIFCLPSEREGFGNSVIEASAVELPVIGSNIYGLQSSLINNYNGVVFKVGDIKDLAKKISYLLTNESQCIKFGKNGREYVKKNFKPQDINNDLVRLIVEI